MSPIKSAHEYHSVVLLDEFEKAHKRLRDVFLSAFDDGRMTDARGKEIDCTNCLFIMTSNLGQKEIKRVLRNHKDKFEYHIDAALKPIIETEFRPEFINRIDKVLPFLPLTQDELQQVVTIFLNKLKKAIVFVRKAKHISSPNLY